jgi:hypothetical protein
VAVHTGGTKPNSLYSLAVELAGQAETWRLRVDTAHGLSLTLTIP